MPRTILIGLSIACRRSNHAITVQQACQAAVCRTMCLQAACFTDTWLRWNEYPAKGISRDTPVRSLAVYADAWL